MVGLAVLTQWIPRCWKPPEELSLLLSPSAVPGSWSILN